MVAATVLYREISISTTANDAQTFIEEASISSPVNGTQTSTEITSLSTPMNETQTSTEEVLLCIDSGFHQCTCGQTTSHLLIYGPSVKLFNKIFSPREIELLKTRNGDSELTTFEIFTAIDQRTRNCTYEFKSYTLNNGSTTYTGTTYGTYRQGLGSQETEDHIVYATWGGASEEHGFKITYRKSDGYLWVREIREQEELDGLSTAYSPT